MQFGKLITAAALALFVAGAATVYAGAQKTLIDHKGHEICVADNSLDAHLAHGDSIIEDCDT